MKKHIDSAIGTGYAQFLTNYGMLKTYLDSIAFTLKQDAVFFDKNDKSAPLKEMRAGNSIKSINDDYSRCRKLIQQMWIGINKALDGLETERSLAQMENEKGI